MGIVKLATDCAGDGFSRRPPLPFEEVVHGASLYAWWAVVTVLYLVASDFFSGGTGGGVCELWGLAVQVDTPSAP